MPDITTVMADTTGGPDVGATDSVPVDDPVGSEKPDRPSC